MAKASTPNREILEAALQGLELQRERLDQQIAEVRGLMGSRVGRPPKTAKRAKSAGAALHKANGRKRRELSPEARKRIAAAQKKRWAAFRKTQG